MILTKDFLEETLDAVRPGHLVEIKESTRKREINDDLYTPGQFLRPLLEIDKFELDPASSDRANEMCKVADKYYTKEDDGLTSPWGNNYVFCNPPFSGTLFTDFSRKMVEHNNGILLALDKTTISTRRLLDPNCSCLMKFKNYRMSFVKPNGEVGFIHLITLYAFGERAAMHLLKVKKEYEKMGLGPYCLFNESMVYNLIKKEEA